MHKKRGVFITLCIFSVVIIVFVGFKFNMVIETDNLINNNQYYEAYKNVNKEGALLSKHLNNQSVKFFDVMTWHYKADIGEGTWILPDMTNWSCAEVAYALHNIGQSYEIEYVDDIRYRANMVVEHFPKCGQVVSKNDVIKLRVNQYYSTDNIYKNSVINYGIVTEIGEWIYFVEDGNIYRSRIDGTEKEKIYQNTNGNFNILSVLGRSNNLYCVMNQIYDLDKSLIVSISLDDFKAKTIAEMSFCTQSKIIGDFLYLTGDKIYYYDTKNEELNVFSDNNLNFNVFDDYIYYVEQKTFKKQRYDCIMRKKFIKTGESEEIICVDGDITNISILGDDLYYIEHNRLDEKDSERFMKFNLTNKGCKQILQKPAIQYIREYEINMWHDNIILFTNGGKLYLYNVNSEKVSEIETPDRIKMFKESEDLLLECYSVIGNYAMFYYTKSSKLFSIYNYPYRYNLLTGEREEFFVSE